MGFLMFFGHSEKLINGNFTGIRPKIDGIGTSVLNRFLEVPVAWPVIPSDKLT